MELVKRSFAGYVNDVMSERLNIAIQSAERVEQPAGGQQQGQGDADGADGAGESVADRIVTTEEELEGFYIVKAVLRSSFPAERVTYRDALRYFAIFCDDNNRKPICRLYFNTSNKYIGIFDAEKNETKHLISSLDDIYGYSEELRATAQKYLDV